MYNCNKCYNFRIIRDIIEVDWRLKSTFFIYLYKFKFYWNNLIGKNSLGNNNSKNDLVKCRWNYLSHSF